MEIRRGTLRAFDSTNYKATIEMAGSIAVWVSDIPVARNIASGEMVAGRNVAVLLFDAANPNDTVVTAVWT